MVDPKVPNPVWLPRSGFVALSGVFVDAVLFLAALFVNPSPAGSGEIRSADFSHPLTYDVIGVDGRLTVTRADAEGFVFLGKGECVEVQGPVVVDRSRLQRLGKLEEGAFQVCGEGPLRIGRPEAAPLAE
ncbi:hypothetical protein [Amaricoccus tamworthensis]|uniref:hypothetical protein n=1 Tax=Amaricoccus tamworthensis TaxID=57002 RepID=UPI003C79A5B7